MHEDENTISKLLRPTIPTISVPIRLVLSSISESEASGSSRVTPVRTRRRPAHGLPAYHPHRNRRKVSAPPELRSHFGGQRSPAKQKSEQGGAIPDSAEYIINISTPTTNNFEGLYSGSDSGVPSEYSSWTPPASQISCLSRHTIEDELTSPGDSTDEVENNRGCEDTKYYGDSDSDIESVESLHRPRRSVAMINPGYTDTESPPVVLSVSGPPPLNRSYTDSNLMLSSPHTSNHRSRTNSMVLQLNIDSNNTVNVPNSRPLPTIRSVSMISLNGAAPSGSPSYPNLASLTAAETTSLYSEVGSTSRFQAQLPYNPSYVGSQAASPSLSARRTDGSIAGVEPGLSPSCGSEQPDSQTDEEKHAWFKNKLNTHLSIIYAIFLCMLAIVIYLADAFNEDSMGLSEGFNIYLIIVQFMWLIYVQLDVRKYLKTVSTVMKESKEREQENKDEVKLEPTGNGQYQLRINLPEPRAPIAQNYGFTSGKHGGSFYLKIGATVFCFGHLTHIGLDLGQKIFFLSDPKFSYCTSTVDVLMSILQPICIFYQLFFIYKYSNLIINHKKKTSKLGLLHCISSSICFWFYAILKETLQALHAKKTFGRAYDIYNSSYSSVSSAASILDGSKDESIESDDSGEHYDGITSLKDTIASFDNHCSKTTELSKMINMTTPYLYPFSIEYNILIVGVWILILENVGRMDRHTHIPSVEMTYEDDTRAFTSNLIIYVDCHSSNKGLFAGLLTTVATVISIILFFILTSSTYNKEIGKIINEVSELFLLIVMTGTIIASFVVIKRLDILKHSISLADDILLYMCLPFIFIYAFLDLVPAIKIQDGLGTIVSLLQVAQVILQTTLICDGMRRCSNSSNLQHKKPGRELITFLVVTNVAMWLLETFEIKSTHGNAEKYKYYGKEMWTILSHVTLPLALFYRFHSSVCFADIWKSSYEPEHE